jgi:hypothetical protein
MENAAQVWCYRLFYNLYRATMVPPPCHILPNMPSMRNDNRCHASKMLLPREKFPIDSHSDPLRVSMPPSCHDKCQKVMECRKVP